MKKQTWWGQGQRYHIGESPSPYVLNEGARWLAANFQAPLPLADFGTWTGRNLPALLSITSNVVATDIPEARLALEEARARYPQVEFVETALARLPWADNTLGGGLCWRVLHNLIGTSETINSLREINRVLKPGSPLLIAVRLDERQGLWSRIASYVRQRPNGAGGLREDIYFTPNSLRLLATLMGFEVKHLTAMAEDEVIDGQLIRNHYLAAHLIKKTDTVDSAWVAAVRRLIIRSG